MILHFRFLFLYFIILFVLSLNYILLKLLQYDIIFFNILNEPLYYIVYNYMDLMKLHHYYFILIIL